MSGRNKSLPGYHAPGPAGHFTNIWEQPGMTTYIGATGQILQAAQFGMKGFDYAETECLSESGTYFCRVKYGATIAAGAGVAQHLTAVSYITLFWFTAANGAPVGNTNLSGETIRIKAVMV